MEKKTLAMCIVLQLLLVSLFSVIGLPIGKMGRSAYASPSSPVWHKTFGGGAGQDIGIQVLQTSDGYAIAATRGGSEAWLIKTDLAGNEQWNKTYGNCIPRGICQTSDGGYAMLGYAGLGGLKCGHWMVKTDSEGNAQWNRVYGFVGFQSVDGMTPTRDGGYALIGYTDSFGAGSLDFYLVKTDAAGYMQWNKTYGGQRSEYGRCVVQTNDGGYALAGDTRSFGSGGDIYLVKTDGEGNMQWSKTYGGAGIEGARSLILTSDGGYVIGGTTTSFGSGGNDFYLVKTDENGNLQWSNAYGGAGYELQFGLIQTNDGGYAITGYTTSFGAGSYDFWLIKTDITGNMQWNKTYGGIMAEYGGTVIQTSDGGYALTGGTSSFGAESYDVWLVKVDEVGTAPEFPAPPESHSSTPEWNKTYGGNGTDNAWDVIQTSDGGYALAGETNSYGTERVRAWLVKTDVNGTLLWEKTFGAVESHAYSIVQTTDGGYALAGSYGSGQDMYLIRTSADGNLLWEKTYLNPYNSYYLHDAGLANSLFQTSDGGFVMVGDSYLAGSGLDVWLVKTDSNGNMQWNKAYSEVAAETGKSVVQTAEGGYAIAADDLNLLYLIKTDPSGNLQWSKAFGNQYSFASSLVQTTDGGYAFAGTTFQGQVTGAVLVKTDGSGNLQWNRVYSEISIELRDCCVVQLGDQGYALAATASSSTVGRSDIWLAKIAPDGYLQWNATYGGPGYDVGSSLVLTRDGGFAVAGYTSSDYGGSDANAYLIKITGGNLIPEYPQILLLTALILATAVAAAVQLPSVRRNKVAQKRDFRP